jgi:hypothetical protein
MAKKKLTECFKALGSAHTQIAAIHKVKGDDDLAVAHSQAAAACADGCDAAKALDDTLGKTLIPDGISSIIPSDVPDSGFGIRAVPRHGSPATPDKLDKATIDAIDPRFRGLVE